MMISDNDLLKITLIASWFLCQVKLNQTATVQLQILFPRVKDLIELLLLPTFLPHLTGQSHKINFLFFELPGSYLSGFQRNDQV